MKRNYPYVYLPKILPNGKAYECPKCKGIMQPHEGSWDVVHCFKCHISADLWYWAPDIIDTNETIAPAIVYTKIMVENIIKPKKSWFKKLINKLF